MVKNHPIGILDSGVGGFSVVRALRQRLPSEKIVYLADPQYFPYGNKTPAHLLQIIQPFFSYFSEEEKTKIVITACGTVSSSCLPELRACYPFPIIGIVEPGAQAAARMTRNGVIAVLATKATVKSALFRQYITECNPSVRVIEKAWPEFIEAVERGEYNSQVHVNKVRRELEELMNEGVDVLVMGCTHFSLISGFFEHLTAERAHVVDPAVATAETLHVFLYKNGIASTGTGELRVMVRGDCDSFQQALASFPELGYHRVERFPEKETPNIMSSKGFLC